MKETKSFWKPMTIEEFFKYGFPVMFIITAIIKFRNHLYSEAITFIIFTIASRSVAKHIDEIKKEGKT